MLLGFRTAMISMLGVLAGCPSDDGAASSSAADSAAASSTGADTTDGATSTNAGTSDGSAGSGSATSGATSTTDATSTTTPGTTDATSNGSDETGAAEDCDGLDEAACSSNPACMGMMGQPIVPETNGAGFCYGEPQFLYCLPAGPPCLPATQTVCMGDMAYEAWSQCGVPSGWQACDPPGDVNGDC